MTLVAPKARIDVALPADVPLAALLPTLLSRTGDRTAAPGAASGWILQRLGERPLDVGKSAQDLTLREGELLYLRQREARLPELVFDDIVDAVATAARERTPRWTASATRVAALASACAAVLVACLVVVQAGPPWGLPAGIAGLLALACVGGGAILSRAVADARAGAVLAAAGLVPGAIAGAAAFALSAAAPGSAAASATGAAATLLVLALVAGFAVVDMLPGFVGVAAAALIAVVSSLVAVSVDRGEAGAVCAGIAALAVTPFLPQLATRLAALPMPSLPLTAEDLKHDTSAALGGQVLDRAASADRFLSATVGGSALVTAVSGVLLAAHGTWSALTLSGVLAAATALRARSFTGTYQRTWLLLSAAAVTAATAAALGASLSPPTILIAVVGPLAVGTAVALAVAVRAGATRVSPLVGRAADIAETLLVVSAAPLALAVVDAYGWLRGLAG